MENEHRTPHEELKGVYNMMAMDYCEKKSPQWYVNAGFQKGVRDTLRILGITVEGVNDFDTRLVRSLQYNGTFPTSTSSGGAWIPKEGDQDAEK